MSKRKDRLIVWSAVALSALILLSLRTGVSSKTDSADTLTLSVVSDTVAPGAEVTFNVGLPSLRARKAATDFVLMFGDDAPGQPIPNLNTSFTSRHAYGAVGQFKAVVLQDGVEAASQLVTVGQTASVDATANPASSNPSSTALAVQPNNDTRVATVPAPPASSPASTAQLTAAENPIVPGQTVGFILQATRSDSDTTDLVVDFGDGSPTKTVSRSDVVLDHTFVLPGSFTVAVRAVGDVRILDRVVERVLTPSEQAEARRNSFRRTLAPAPLSAAGNGSYDAARVQVSAPLVGAGSARYGATPEPVGVSKLSDDVRRSYDAAVKNDPAAETRHAVVDATSALKSYFQQDDPAAYRERVGQSFWSAPDANGGAGIQGALMGFLSRISGNSAASFSAPSDSFKVFGSGLFAESYGTSNSLRTSGDAGEFGLTFGGDRAKTTWRFVNSDLLSIGSASSPVADRVGFSSTTQRDLGNATRLSVGYGSRETRSSASRADSFSTALDIKIAKSTSLSMGVNREDDSNRASKSTTESANVELDGRLFRGSYALSASTTRSQDTLSAANSAVERSFSARYTIEKNDRRWNFSVNSRAVDGSGAIVATWETLSYGFPVRGKLFNGTAIHGLDLGFEANNGSTQSSYSSGTDKNIVSVLTFHLPAKLILGIRTGLNWHKDVVSANDRRQGTIGFTLDLTK